MAENEESWKEENGLSTKAPSASAEMRSAGITSGGMESDTENLGQSGMAPEGMPGGPEPAVSPEAAPPAPTA